MKIDNIDKKILEILLKDAKKTFKSIATECKISIEVARVRYKNLKKKGIITGSIMQILPKNIGINCFGILEIETEQNMEQKIQNILEEQSYILAILKDYLDNNIKAYFALPNLEALQNAISSLKNQKSILAIKSTLYSGLPFNDFPEKLIINKNAKKNNKSTTKLNFEHGKNNKLKKKYIQTKKLKKMDKNTRQIAKILSGNARISLSKIAKQQNISLKKVKKISQKLKKTLFKKGTITINPFKLGYKAAVEFKIEIKPGYKIDEVHDRLYEIPNITSISKIIGEGNLLAAGPVKDFNDLFTMRNQVKSITGVIRIKSRIIQGVSSWPTNFFALLL